jgi:hypothetical protein
MTINSSMISDTESRSHALLHPVKIYDIGMEQLRGNDVTLTSIGLIGIQYIFARGSKPSKSLSQLKVSALNCDHNA